MQQTSQTSPQRRPFGLALLFSLGLAPACATDDEAKPPPQSLAAPAAAAEKPPLGQLPEGVRPTRYRLHLDVVPADERFSGEVRIDVELDQPRQVIWMHGASLDVGQATYTGSDGQKVEGTFKQENELGLASLTFPRAVGPGPGHLDLAWTAPFDDQLKGLYKVVAEDESYAFTQFEATSARYCFPGFDEPRFKVPFDLSVTAKKEHAVITTSPEASQVDAEGGKVTHVFKTTAKLPTYLIAFAVGPLAVVDGPTLPPNEVRREPLPFRGVAVKGKGPQLAYAMKETGKILSALEGYFGQPYPFQKLDIIAVPDFNAGAMENVGAVTFREWLLLVDEENAPVDQKRAFAGVMAHELAHMWFGNLVTMPWWDDIWLNEAFATWMAAKVVERTYPEYEAPLSMVARAQGAMGTDSLTSARQIRQPIKSDHDIRNAFDSITYSKGGGVLSMFERWLTEEVFRDGVRRYIRKHGSGSATYEDLLAALGEASGKDVATPFKTFLFQPGVPLVEARLSCTEGEKPTVELSQSRYFPAGSRGDANQTWQIPVCIKYGAGRDVRESCTLLKEKVGKVELDAGCPDWVMPNSGSAGYYRWTLPAEDLARLKIPEPHSGKGRGRAQVALPPRLDVTEWMGVADAVKISFSRGLLDTAATMEHLTVLAGHPHQAVSSAPMSLIGFVREKIVSRGKEGQVARFARELYRPVLKRLGEKPKADETPERKRLRAQVMEFLVWHGEDKELRARLAPLGRAYLGVDRGGAIDKSTISPDLARVAVLSAVLEGDAAFFDARVKQLADVQDPVVRGHLLSALPRVSGPELTPRARQLLFDDRLRANEVTGVLWGLFAAEPEESWAWFVANYDRIKARVPEGRRGSLPWVGTALCSEEGAKTVQAFFEKDIESLMGGPRNLAGSTEAIRLCAARVQMQRESADRFFDSPRTAHAQ